MNLKKWLLAATMAVGMATGASAATLIGSSSGQFTSDSSVFGATHSGNTLTWPIFDNSKSTLTIDNFGFNEGLAIGNQTVQVGSLTWVNESSIAFVTPDEFTATATHNLSYSSPSVASGSEAVQYTISNTSNPSSDEIAALAIDALFDFGGVPLDLGQGVTIVGYSFGFASGAGSFDGSLWLNPEGGTSVLGIYADVSAVPLPAAGFLLLGGLGGLAALRRRRKAA